MVNESCISESSATAAALVLEAVFAALFALGKAIAVPLVDDTAVASTPAAVSDSGHGDLHEFVVIHSEVAIREGSQNTSIFKESRVNRNDIVAFFFGFASVGHGLSKEGS